MVTSTLRLRDNKRDGAQAKYTDGVSAGWQLHTPEKGETMFSEFKKFIMRGNVLDLAIGVIIGAAFGKIVSSMVDDILMPVLGLFLGKIDFSSLFISLN